MNNLLSKIRILCFLVLGYAPLSHADNSKTDFPTEVMVMSYNAENLFDTYHDEGKVDWTYLPLHVKQASQEAMDYCHSLRNRYYRRDCLELDWSHDVLLKKIQQIGRVIRQVNNGHGPDIIVLQEVENYNVLKMLRDYGLARMGYNEVVLVDGPDNRGIDIGILSKYPLVGSPFLHEIDLTPAFPERPRSEVRPTRGILEATFNIRGKQLTILGNHWPSQGNKDETRYIAAQTMNEIASRIDHPTIALGDFNTTKSDEPHGINHWVLNRSLPNFFYASELERYGRTNPARGTHWYRGEWTTLDKIFFLGRMTRKTCQKSGCIEANWRSYTIHRYPFMVEDVTTTNIGGEGQLHRDVPKRFDPETGEGVSDHLPVTMTFRLY